MKIFKLNTDTPFNENNICLAVGNFDGFHRGHQKIIRMLKKISKDNNLLSAIMSFDPHPRLYFDNSAEDFNIYTKEDKLKFLNSFEINIYIDFLFDHKLSDDHKLLVMIFYLQISYYTDDCRHVLKFKACLLNPKTISICLIFLTAPVL